MSNTVPCPSSIPLVDIGANLVDEMYQGIYNGSKKHEPDLDKVLLRAQKNGIEKIFVTAGNLDDSVAAAELVKKNNSYQLYSTVGVHPTRCSEFKSKFSSPAEYINALKSILDNNKEKVIAIGEFGLDYERTQFCDVETQNRFFELQLKELGPYSKLPLFLHCRAAAKDLARILTENKECFLNGGVVHSFDGTLEEMHGFVELGLHIGINGCSLKTEENCNVVREIPPDRLLLETDAPWCGIRPSHFSAKFVKSKFEVAKKNWTEGIMFKSRNEPQTIVNVLEVVSALKETSVTDMASIIYSNTNNLFFPK